MAFFLVGLLVGLGAMFAIIRYVMQMDESTSLRAGVTRLLIREDSGEHILDQEALREIREQDPEFARRVDEEPAVPVDHVPLEISHHLQDEIEAAETEEKAEGAAGKYIKDTDAAKAISVLCKWRTRPNNTESQYENSFRMHAKRSGYSGEISEQVRISWGGDGGTRVAIPDFILKERVLLEFKADLQTSSDADRAMGQMLRYLLAWKTKGPGILAVCGRVSPEIRFLIRLYIRSWRRTLKLPVTVFFKQVDKSPGDADVEMPEEAPMHAESHDGGNGGARP